MKKVLMVLAGLFVALAGSAADEHVESVISNVLACVQRIRAVDPNAVPMAFWDFDGTIIDGDISEGLPGADGYKGMVETLILSGKCGVYQGPAGVRQYFDRDYPRLNEIGRWVAWPYNAQIFAGARAAEIEELTRMRCREIYSKFYFASSMEILRRLEAAGVENHIISASPEIWVKGTAESLGLPRERLNAIRVGIDGGRVTTEIIYPLPFGEGKVDVLRKIVLASPHAYPVAGFGNSYKTDAAFLKYIVEQRLPNQAKPFALMINGFEPLPGYEGLFTCVEQRKRAGSR